MAGLLLVMCTTGDSGNCNIFLKVLEDTARYAGLLQAPAEGFVLRPWAFFALRAKEELIMLFWPILGQFWCPVVTLLIFSSNTSNLENYP